MFNVAVINLKKILKDIFKIIIVIAIITMIFNFSSSNLKIDFNKLKIINNSYLGLISSNITLANAEDNNSKNSVKEILNSEYAFFGTSEEELMYKESLEEAEFLENDGASSLVGENELGNNEENNAQDATTDNSSIVANLENIPPLAKTEVIAEHNKKDVYTNTYGSVKIKNESKYELTTEMLTPNVDFNNKKDILIFHTHTCESYTPTENNNYVSSGNFRTTDLNYSVAHVGDVLTDYLTATRI